MHCTHLLMRSKVTIRMALNLELLTATGSLESTFSVELWYYIIFTIFWPLLNSIYHALARFSLMGIGMLIIYSYSHIQVTQSQHLSHITAIYYGNQLLYCYTNNIYEIENEASLDDQETSKAVPPCAPGTADWSVLHLTHTSSDILCYVQIF